MWGSGGLHTTNSNNVQCACLMCACLCFSLPLPHTCVGVGVTTGVTDCLGHVALLAELFRQLGENRPPLKAGVVGVFIANEENSTVSRLANSLSRLGACFVLFCLCS